MTGIERAFLRFNMIQQTTQTTQTQPTLSSLLNDDLLSMGDVEDEEQVESKTPQEEDFFEDGTPLPPTVADALLFAAAATATSSQSQSRSRLGEDGLPRTIGFVRPAVRRTLSNLSSTTSPTD